MVSGTAQNDRLFRLTRRDVKHSTVMGDEDMQSVKLRERNSAFLLAPVTIARSLTHRLGYIVKNGQLRRFAFNSPDLQGFELVMIDRESAGLRGLLLHSRTLRGQTKL